MIREIGEVQQIQKLISAEEMARATRDQEMSTPTSQDSHASSQEIDNKGQDQSQASEEKLSNISQESSSNSLDLEDMMEQTEVKTVHQSSPVKEL